MTARFSYPCDECPKVCPSGQDWLAHKCMEHNGATTTQMRHAGISGNPSQRRTDAEANYGIVINSEPHTRENGRAEAIYTLGTREDLVLRELRESPEPDPWHREPAPPEPPAPAVAIAFDIRSEEARRRLAAALDYDEQVNGKAAA